jgi:hypothetical protein
MPCSDYRDEPNYEIARLEKRLDAATKAACEMWNTLLEADMFELLSPSTRLWGREHEAMDRKRIAAEQAEKDRKQARTRALSKLTPAERKALGLR